LISKDLVRPTRVADQIRRELGSLIVRDVSDPRLEGIMISGVEVSRDLAHAKVFVTLRESVELDPTLRVLRQATGYLRYKLAQRVRMRVMPELDFHYDSTLDTANRIDRLIDRAVAQERPADAGLRTVTSGSRDT